MIHTTCDICGLTCEDFYTVTINAAGMEPLHICFGRERDCLDRYRAGIDHARRSFPTKLHNPTIIAQRDQRPPFTAADAGAGKSA